jgi:hypothetical protein
MPKKGAGWKMVAWISLLHDASGTMTISSLPIQFILNVALLTVSVDVLNGDTGHDSIQVG